MKVGYLHIGVSQAQESGVTRYGRMMAAEALQRADLDVLEHSLVLGGDKSQNRQLISKAAQFMSQADVIHLQYSKYIWGRGWDQLSYLKRFNSECPRPFVVTLHDVYPKLYPPYDFLTAFIQENYQHRQYSRFKSWALRSTVRSYWQNYLADHWTLRWLLSQAATILVCTEVEKQRLKHFAKGSRITVSPHFVERRDVVIHPLQARADLGLEGFKVITLQGFIYPGKGHPLIIEAMTELPQDVKVIFVGGPSPGSEGYLANLLELAESRGVRDRLHITGYLSAEQLEQYLMASDLAVCPFETLSASGSLSTWISLARPILCADLPQIAEYNQLEPGAIKIFRPYIASELALAIQDYFHHPHEYDVSALIRLREKLLISKILDQHLNFYRGALSP